MIVYYTNKLNSFVDDPEPLYKSLTREMGIDQIPDNKENTQLLMIKKCPSIIEYCKNVFVVRNMINYNLGWDGNSIFTENRDQEFFKNWVLVRNSFEGLVSYLYPCFIFFAETPVLMEVLPPFFHGGDMVNKGIMAPGVYDAGRHFRSIETAFKFRKKNDNIKIEETEPLYYIKFNTPEKITFKKFLYSDDISKLEHGMMGLREGQWGGKVKSMDFWYQLFGKNYRKKILKSIKNNLL